MIRTKSEDAVSPVIGVMLMLVVTIVIAAVVAAFAGGLGADAETAPTTVLDVHDLSTGRYDTVEKVTVPAGTSYYATDANGNQVTMTAENKGDAGAEFLYYYVEGDQSKVIAMKTLKKTISTMYFWNDAQRYGNNPDLQEQYLTINTEDVPNEAKTVTISSLHGDVLDVSKLSVRIYSGDTLISENPVNTPSGVLSPGDSISVTLSDPTNNMISKSKSYKLEVLYGSHSIVSKKLTATQEW